ncbi:MAG: LysM peptidoglycan-binding domain-containing protein [Chitinophagales bacterium]|nr:LysM peptidoglycan-binding domain-containing protein [Chitinophagales bacterium]MDW8272790.1 LysM peptidoglycan-binding domain-containing protein [Chitinophagales bacterium]
MKKVVLALYCYFVIAFCSAQTRFLKHKVKPGENIYTIAAKYQTDAKYLLMFNNFPDNVKLAPGDIVLIRELLPGEEPATEVKTLIEPSEYYISNNKESLPDKKTSTSNDAKLSLNSANNTDVIEHNGVFYKRSNNGIHVVEKGQTFYRISLIYGISIEKLKELNGLKTTDLEVGQKLKVPVR